MLMQRGLEDSYMTVVSRRRSAPVWLPSHAPDWGRVTLVAAAVSFGGAASSASAQWTVVNLRPAGAVSANAYAAGGGQQAGHARFGNQERAGLWNGTGASWVDLHPAGALFSSVYGTSGGQQAGFARFGNAEHAGWWNGTAASWVDLNPAGANYSEAHATDGGRQVGYAQFGLAGNHASLWSGTAASWVDLNPVGSVNSYAWAISGGQQGGSASVAGRPHAGIWSGSAASWVDMHPAGATQSVVTAMSDGRQAGHAYFGSGQIMIHAGMWTGTARSWVDLHPAGATHSQAFAAGARLIGGAATFNGIDQAGLWSDSPASWVNLHSFLPPTFARSVVHGISTDGVNIYAAGYGTEFGRDHPLLWIRPVPAPGAAAVMGLGGLLVARRRGRA